MERMGLLIDYDFCCGCHTCEVACQKEHDYAPGQWGVKVCQVGPFTVEGTKDVVFDCVPVPTNLCDLCEERVRQGKLPTCVHHCQTGCMKYGTVEELAGQMTAGDKCTIFSPLG